MLLGMLGLIISTHQVLLTIVMVNLTDFSTIVVGLAGAKRGVAR